MQITLLSIIKPVSALLSPYWSQRVRLMHGRLISNIVWGNIFRFLPFLLCPFASSPWFYILAFGLHMVFCRGVTPTWMEILKISFSDKQRGKVFALASSIDYMGMISLPFIFGGLLDKIPGVWRWLFPITALIGMLGSLVAKLLLKSKEVDEQPVATTKNMKETLISPWKDAWCLVVERKDFAWFQWGFFLGGAGLMVLQTSLPTYFVDSLHLSYRELLFAIAALKGVGFALSSPLWVKCINKLGILVTCIAVTFFAAIFPFLLMIAPSFPSLIFISYLLYGIMQGGSELSWKLSGPIFSKKASSIPYSSLNILTVGIRGLIFPVLGTVIFTCTQSYNVVFTLGMILCVSGSLSMYFNHRRQGALLKQQEILSVER